MLVYVAFSKRKVDKWVVGSQSSSAWNLVVVSSLLSRMMKISGGLSWIVWPQKPSRLNLFAPFNSFSDQVVAVRVPGWLFPIMVPLLLCCMLATVARTVPEISCNQPGSRISGMAPFGSFHTGGLLGGAIVGGVWIPTV